MRALGVVKKAANEVIANPATQIYGGEVATALNPQIGYDKASDATKTALKEGKTVKQVVVEKGRTQMVG